MRFDLVESPEVILETNRSKKIYFSFLMMTMVERLEIMGLYGTVATDNWRRNEFVVIYSNFLYCKN